MSGVGAMVKAQKSIWEIHRYTETFIYYEDIYRMHMNLSKHRKRFASDMLGAIKEADAEDIITINSQAVPWASPMDPEAFVFVERIEILLKKKDGEGDEEIPYVGGGEVEGNHYC